MQFDLQLFGGRGGTSKLGGGIPANGSARSGGSASGSGSSSAIKSVAPDQTGTGYSVQTTNGAYDITPMGNGYTVDIGGDEVYFKTYKDAIDAINKDALTLSGGVTAQRPAYTVSKSSNGYDLNIEGQNVTFASASDAKRIAKIFQADYQLGDIVKVYPQNTGDTYITVDTAVSRPSLSYMVDKNGKVKDLNSTASAQVNKTLNAGPTAPTKAAIPASRVSVSTSAYQGSHGSTPRGSGTWAFDIGSETKFFSGKYSDAKKKAINYAAQKGISNIKVGP